MRWLSGALAAVIVLGLAACSRGAPEARFDSFTAPFVRVSGICWPLPVSPEFPWLMRQRTVAHTFAGNQVTFAAQAFEVPPALVTADLDAALAAAGYHPESALDATGHTVVYRRGDSWVSVRVLSAPASELPVTADIHLAMRGRTVEAGPCPPTEEL